MAQFHDANIPAQRAPISIACIYGQYETVKRLLDEDAAIGCQLSEKCYRKGFQVRICDYACHYDMSAEL